MKANIINALIYIVFAIGLLGAGDLVLNEIRESNICPKILGIPACYIILTCFVLPFLICLLYTSPSPRDLSTSRMPSSA